MQHTLRTQVFVLFFVLFSSAVWANNPPPANDDLTGATYLGLLPSPGPCPATPDGDTVGVYGTTNFATYTSFDHTATDYFTSASPNVWYHFRASGEYTTINVNGWNGLDTFYVQLWYSPNSNSTGLIPHQYAYTSNGSLTATLPTPSLYSEYYLEIGGHTTNETGDFHLQLKAHSYCGTCVKRAVVEMTPAPAYGTYALGDTVTMCTTVERWDAATSAYLHGIVPEFGNGWDTSTLTPVQAPATASSTTANYWHWMNNIFTPAGYLPGYFFDSNSNNSPYDNAGDNGNVMTSWEACWKIRTKTQCTATNLGVSVHYYSDAETGNGNSASVCNPYAAPFINTAMNCCAALSVNVSGPFGCTGSATVTVTPDPSMSASQIDYTIYNAGGNVAANANSVTGNAYFNLPPGDYTIEAVDNNSACTMLRSFSIEPYLEAYVVQTALGCGSGTGTAFAYPQGGGAPFTYYWPSIPTASQNDSVAIALPDGWVSVIITDAFGCVAKDSVYITSGPVPNVAFDYTTSPVCASTDTVNIATLPGSPGGTFTLVSPTNAGIFVNPQTGVINMANSTVTPPYYVYVQYAFNNNCNTSYTDSIYVMATPAAPTLSGNNAVGYCIGSPAPQFNVSVPIGTFALWYDNQTTQYANGNMFTTPLNSSTTAGTYYYGVVTVPLANVSCTSLPVLCVVNAVYPPYISISADTTICPGETATLAVSPCSTCVYTWNPVNTIGPSNVPTIEVTPSQTTTYTVTASDPNGCSVSLSTTVNIDAEASCLFTVYHGFTPNGDGHNDTWIIDGAEQYPNTTVWIYNRWGKRVWSATAYDNVNVVWNGTDENNTHLPDGTYYYIITVGTTQTNGWVELSH